MTGVPVQTAVISLRPAQIRRRQRILKAAKRLFLDQGFGHSSMEAIAALAQVSKATLYGYFASKEALFAAVIEARRQRYTKQLGSVKLFALPAPVGLELIATTLLELILSKESLALYRVVVAEAPRFPQMAAAFYHSGPGRLRRHLSDYLSELARRGELVPSDSELAAGQFLGLVQGPLHFQHLLGLGEDLSSERLRRVAASAVATFLRALTPTAGSAVPAPDRARIPQSR